jgi:hypothetical protein
MPCFVFALFAIRGKYSELPSIVIYVYSFSNDGENVTVQNQVDYDENGISDFIIVLSCDYIITKFYRRRTL